MRCDEIQELLGEMRSEDLPVSVREHLSACPECRSYAEGWTLARTGLRTLAEEPVPEASLGFVARVTRRLEDLAGSGRSWMDYVESAGRRFVYAALVLTTMSVVALLVPSSGPLRTPPSAWADLYVAQSEALQAYRDPVFSADSIEDQEAAAVNPAPAGGRPESVLPRSNLEKGKGDRKAVRDAR